jgi:hypothetical protein
MAYFNIHSDLFPNGEIRGFLEVPGPVVGAGISRPDLGWRRTARLDAAAEASSDRVALSDSFEVC